MALLLREVVDALHERGVVAMTIAFSDSGQWQASGRREGSGWSIGHGADAEAAVGDLIEQYRYAQGRRHESRYFRGPRELAVTWNGQPPLAADGPWEELTAAEWVAAKRAMGRTDVYGDLFE